MDASSFNLFDAFVALTLFASGVFAFRRGLVREIMALGTWVLAAIISFAFFPLALPFFEEHIKNEALAKGATGLGLFSLAIVILVPFGEYLSGLVKSPALSSIDRSLGFVFGIVRGFLVVCLLFLGLIFIWPEETEDAQPKWLAGARTKPALAYGVKIINSLVPNATEKMGEEIEKSRETAEEAAKRLEEMSTPVPTRFGDDGEASSYGDDARDIMDTLIDGNENE